MDLQIKLINNFSRGSTFVEMIVVIGIIALMLSVSTSVYNSFKTHENLEIGTTSLIEAIRHAQANAQSGKGDSSWGVKLFLDSFVIFKGESYISRSETEDMSFDLSGGLQTSGLSEVVFIKVTGTTSNTGTITLTNSYGSKNILINEKGTITY